MVQQRYNSNACLLLRRPRCQGFGVRQKRRIQADAGLAGACRRQRASPMAQRPVNLQPCYCSSPLGLLSCCRWIVYRASISTQSRFIRTARAGTGRSQHRSSPRALDQAHRERSRIATIEALRAMPLADLGSKDVPNSVTAPRMSHCPRRLSSSWRRRACLSCQPAAC
jgi:hypothetical protein